MSRILLWQSEKLTNRAPIMNKTIKSGLPTKIKFSEEVSPMVLKSYKKINNTENTKANNYENI